MAPCSSDSIGSLETIDARAFARDHLRVGTPILLTRAFEHWTARRTWTFDRFRSLDPEREVLVEIGSVVDRPDARVEAWTLGRYLDALDREYDGDEPVPYLSQFPVLDAFPQLRSDVPFDLWPAGWRCWKLAWIGPRGTYTGLHRDRADNLLVQLQGRKRIRLFDPSQTPRMYPSQKFDRGSEFSMVDGREPDPERHPGFARAKSVEVTLQPGHALFIPADWWHDVEALDPSISVSGFAYGPWGLATRWLLETTRSWLHHRGCYGTFDNCTCHNGTPS